MNERQKAYFRNKLVTWKSDILREARETLEILQQENAKTIPISRSGPLRRPTAPSNSGPRPPAQADRQDRFGAAAARRGHLWLLRGDGCEPISLRRLDARPIATLSIEAQERHERREKVYRDD